MKHRISLFLGIFAVMALSNAIVPVLPLYSGDPSLQGAIFSAYFLGAFLTTLPAGILSDRYGRMPLIRAGLFITVVSGILLFLTADLLVVIAVRILEGIGAGVFVSSALSYTNAQPGHRRESGILMAMLNTGLVVGLALSGWLDTVFPGPAAGIIIFTVLAVVPAGLSLVVPEPEMTETFREQGGLFPIVRDNCGIWYSALILVGVTGVAASLYPKYSMLSPAIVGVAIAAMSVSTIVFVIMASRGSWAPVPVIRWSAVCMAAGIIITFFNPVGFLILGGVAGVVIVAQMAAFAGKRDQGAIMGLFSTTGYLGMTLLPFICGLIARVAGFPTAFLAAALLALTVIPFIRSS